MSAFMIIIMMALHFMMAAPQSITRPEEGEGARGGCITVGGGQDEGGRGLSRSMRHPPSLPVHVAHARKDAAEGAVVPGADLTLHNRLVRRSAVENARNRRRQRRCSYSWWLT